MASLQRCSSTPGLPHVSALNTLLETQHMKSITHRLFYIAKIPPERNNYSSITDHYEKLFTRLLKFNLGESITGLLLIYPTCIIHVIESTSEILYGIIQDLVLIEKLGMTSLLLEARILVISHNIPSRLFQHWYFHIKKLPVHNLYGTMQGKSEEVEAEVEEVLTTMLKLGTFMSKMPEAGSKGPGEDLQDLSSEWFVQEETIQSLIKSDLFQKPEEFLAMYDRPINASNGSDEPLPFDFYL